jgi:predicted lipoprotein
MLKNIFLLIIVITVLASCSKDDDTSGLENNDDFNRVAMLSNIADNIIIPSYQDLNTKLGVLVSTKDDFITDPNSGNLSALRISWLNAYKSWQFVEMFNIGKAEEISYHFQMNIYPTNDDDIKNNITSGDADLEHPNNNDAVGFPALDYMLYGIENTDFAIIEKYTSDPESENYKVYLSDLVIQMKNLTESVLNDWTSSYRNIFINSTSNTATSGFNQFVNDYIYYYEKGLRANKIGIPAGNFSSSPLPNKVEALYNKESSKTLALEALNAVQNLFNGKSYNTNSMDSSFSDYLIYLNKSDLVTLINEKLDLAREKINLLDDDFYLQINEDNTKMTNAYDALQTVVVLLKVDMLQVFNISVDYVDADGD